MRLGQLTCAAIAAAIFSLPAPARAQQAINLSLGGFVVTGEDARVDDDVFFANREILEFDIDDFNTGSANIEWLLPVGEFFEIGAGAGFSSRRVPTVYSDFVDRMVAAYRSEAAERSAEQA